MHENSDIPLQYSNMNDEDFKDAIIKIFDSEAHKIYLQLVQYYQLDALRLAS